tara:strand:- start:4440 stop:4598 length:159 start_codon:yes stop_codon:yes gene_type:complete
MASPVLALITSLVENSSLPLSKIAAQVAQPSFKAVRNVANFLFSLSILWFDL